MLSLQLGWFECVALNVGNIHDIPRFLRSENRKKKYSPRKNNHIKQYLRGSIFTYVHKVAVISLFTGGKKIQEAIVFFLSKQHTKS